MVSNSPSTVLPVAQIKKAFFALVANGVRAAPLWDSKKQSFVGEEGKRGTLWGDSGAGLWGRALAWGEQAGWETPICGAAVTS